MLLSRNCFPCSTATSASMALVFLLGSASCSGAEPAAAPAAHLAAGLIARIGQQSTRFAVTCFALAPDGKVVALGSDDGTIRLWSVAEGKVTGTIDMKEKSYIGAIAFSLEGKQLAFHEDGEPIRMWDVERMSEAGRTSVAYPFVEHLSFSPGGKQIGVVSDTEGLIWNVDTGKIWKSEQPVSSLAFSPDGQTLALGFNTVRLVHATSGRSIRELGKIEARVSRLEFAPAGDQLLVVDGSCPGTFVRALEVGSGEEFVMGEKLRSDNVGASYSADGQMIFVSDGSADAVVWDAATGRKLQTLPGIDRSTNTFVFSRDGKWLLTGRNNVVSDVVVWELPGMFQPRRPAAQ